MRRILAAAGALSLTVLALTACSTAAGDAAASCQTDVPDSTALDLVRIDGETVGTLPEVVITAPVRVDEVSAAERVPGEAERVVTSPAQPLLVDFTILDGETGAVIFASPYERGPAQPTTLSGWAQDLPGIYEALECAAPGSRTVVAIPAADLSPDFVAQTGLDADGSLVVVADISEVYLAAADGAEQFNDRLGMPSVVRAPDGRPGVVLPQADPPAERVVETLKKGDGAELAAGDAAFAHVTSVLWPGGTVAETTWDAIPRLVTVGSDEVPYAVDLEGMTVGSQAMVVVPGGESGAPAQVYVIDILGIAPTA